MHTGKWSLTDKSETKLSDIVQGAVVYTWSIKVAIVCVMRLDLEISCVRSNSCTIFGHFVLIMSDSKSILKSPITIYSRPVVCAMESSSSNKSTHSYKSICSQVRSGVQVLLYHATVRSNQDNLFPCGRMWVNV